MRDSRETDEVLVCMAQRLQGQVERQLTLVERLYATGVDNTLPDLAEMRTTLQRSLRGVENLLVLGGAQQGPRARGPRTVADLLADARAGVEDPGRVDIDPAPDAGVASRAVTALLALFTELLAHALAVSPGGGTIQVTSRRAEDGGVLVEVATDASGPTAAELEELNRRLADRPIIDDIVSNRVGLFVAARMAARSGAGLRVAARRLGGHVTVVHCPPALLDPAPLDTVGAGTARSWRPAPENGRGPDGDDTDGYGTNGSGTNGYGTNGSGHGGNGYSANGYSGNGYTGNGYTGNGYTGNGYPGNGSGTNGYTGNGYTGNGYGANGDSGGGGFFDGGYADRGADDPGATPPARLPEARLDDLLRDPLRDPLRRPDPLVDPLPLLPPVPREPAPWDAGPFEPEEPLRPVGDRPVEPAPERYGSAVDELFGPLTSAQRDSMRDSGPTPIYEAVASAWFADDDDDDAGSGPGAPEWDPPQDAEWRAAAERAAARSVPEPETSTAAGLPRRRPGTQMVAPPRRGTPAPPQGSQEREPEKVRERLAVYQQGLQRGRHRAGDEDAFDFDGR